mmetsp:Transcript_14686/g.24251  ORF Transcript_14686/g.24251 Transcript_14686/m.24251 type:complete len:384 (-) Transcript_14686:759-1910(-)|eukprot:CAMPEP_0184654832 /NCGR_PEP_ID=MMETSP0308-20130426/12477_1 /TAXON_ID=38269 /ORGANISM="Gloeochaete witrockiana, Strain SAG 46.84" /LENGTH=383 /DNA_ID=CAMNT_0027091003 /DNA_START=105 /DNA_END=1256 /DNA_ORIENTATION=+
MAGPIYQPRVQQNGEAADPTTKVPPFTYTDVKQAIPEKYFKPSIPRSLFYCARDFFFAASLFIAVNLLDRLLVDNGLPWARFVLWPAYWFAQGTIFWAIFVVGHDCGHGSFSRSVLLNEIIGTFTHASILVPYNSWRISHRRHHSNTGSVEHDESWYPTSKKDYESLNSVTRFLRYDLFMFLWPLYLLGFRGRDSSGHQGEFGFGGSHFDPYCDLFKEHERPGVVRSSLAVLVVLVAVLKLGWTFGAVFMVANYWLPWVIFSMWLAIVTYLHHHDVSIPWYRSEEWQKLRGALSTIDVSYGKVIDHIHHDIGTHVVHHIFHQIPHYHLKDATEAVKPLLGKYYRKSNRGVIGGLWDAHKGCKYIPDEGGVVFFNGYYEKNKAH